MCGGRNLEHPKSDLTDFEWRITNGVCVFTAFQVGLLCLVAIATSYPLEENQPGQDGRVLRRRNQQENPVAKPNRNRQVKPAARPQKQRYTPEETAPSAFQERYASPVSPKRKASPVEARESIRNEPDYESAASGGSYDEGAAKFEQGVQNSASSYNSDQVRRLKNE